MHVFSLGALLLMLPTAPTGVAEVYMSLHLCAKGAATPRVAAKRGVIASTQSRYARCQIFSNARMEVTVSYTAVLPELRHAAACHPVITEMLKGGAPQPVA